jgi:drug/metabolite transporter (DMT)-like permease
MVLAMALFISMDTMAKHLGQSYPVIQIVWVRYLVAGTVLALILNRRLAAKFKSRNMKLQLLRGGLLVATNFLFYTGLRFMPLAESSAISFVGPLMVTALAVPFLGERVGVRRWASVLVGFAGALVVVRPGLGFIDWAALFPLGAAACFAVTAIVTRKLGGLDPVSTTLLLTTFVGAALTSTVAPFFWTPPTAPALALMVCIGLVGVVAHFAIIKAFVAAPATTVAPYNYTTIVWATVFGFVVFGDRPDPWTLSGAAIIVGSGLYIYYRERIARAKVD